MSSLAERVKKLKNSAKANRNLGLYPEAIDDLDAAIALLERERACAGEGAGGGAAAPEADDASPEWLELQLADCLGMKGGVYRREGGRLPEALAMYERGLEHERRLGKDSYNLSNTIALSIALDGDALSGKRADLDHGVELITRQVASDRCEQWWAYADLGMFHLLRGERERAIAQYARFEEKGARREDYETTIDVLRTIHDSLAASGQVAAAADVAAGIAFLSERQPPS